MNKIRSLVWISVGGQFVYVFTHGDVRDLCRSSIHYSVRNLFPTSEWDYVGFSPQGLRFTFYNSISNITRISEANKKQKEFLLKELIK